MVSQSSLKPHYYSRNTLLGVTFIRHSRSKLAKISLETEINKNSQWLSTFEKRTMFLLATMLIFSLFSESISGWPWEQCSPCSLNFWLSVLSLLYLRTVSLFMLKKELSSFCLLPSPFTESCFLKILRILSKIFLSYFLQLLFYSLNGDLKLCFKKMWYIKLYPKLEVSLRPRSYFH